MCDPPMAHANRSWKIPVAVRKMPVAFSGAMARVVSGHVWPEWHTLAIVLQLTVASQSTCNIYDIALTCFLVQCLRGTCG